MVSSPLLLENHSVLCPGAKPGEELLKEFPLEDCVEVQVEEGHLNTCALKWRPLTSSLGTVCLGPQSGNSVRVDVEREDPKGEPERVLQNHRALGSPECSSHSSPKARGELGKTSACRKGCSDTELV